VLNGYVFLIKSEPFRLRDAPARVWLRSRFAWFVVTRSARIVICTHVLNKEVSLVVVSNERAREVDGTLVPWSALCWRVW